MLVVVVVVVVVVGYWYWHSAGGSGFDGLFEGSSFNSCTSASRSAKH